MTVRVRYIVPNSYGTEHIATTILTNVASIAPTGEPRAVNVTFADSGVLKYAGIIAIKVWP